MRRLLPLSLLWLLAVTTGCGNDHTCYPTGNLGSCCADSDDCTDLICLEDFPGGYCSRDCGQDHACPEGGHCLAYQAAGGTRTICLVGCASGQPPCRDGYVCRLVSDIQQPVCVPGG